MKTIKKPISILLSVLMVFSVFAVVPFTASAATTGSFGSLTWNIDDDGTLTFSGSGSVPRDGFRGNVDVKKVIINDSVTELGAYAFYECPNLKEVDIQNPSVSLTGSNHFSYSGVATVTLPEGMTTIPQHMFRACGALTTVDLPSTIKSIAGGAFWHSGLQSISVPEGATYGRDSFETGTLRSLTLEGSAPMKFTGGEFTFLPNAATVYIPAGSTYEYSTTTATLYVKDQSNDRAQDRFEEAQEEFNYLIERRGMPPQEALYRVNDEMRDMGAGEDAYGVNVTTEGPFTVELNEGDKCEAVFGGATIGKYVPASTGYTVTWKNWNGDILETDTDVADGTTPTYDGEDPTKPADDTNTYTFKGWDPAVTEVTGDATYTAKFDATPKAFVASVTAGGTTTKYTDFGTAVSDWTNGSTLTLLADVTISSTIGVSGTKTLDLNGYGIKTVGGVAITVNGGADLTMKDSAPTRTDTGTNRPNGVKGGYLTGYNGGNNSACVVINAGKFTMDGGSITGNISSNNGAGVMIKNINDNEFVMTGGSITNNKAQYGAGIYCNKNGKVTMNGGIVSDNVTTSTIAHSGGMLIHGTLTMNGGTVTRNTVGVQVWLNTSVVNLSGSAKITDNTVNGTAYGNLDMSGSGVASQNCVKVTGKLDDDALIGITMKTPGVFTSSSTTNYNVASKFKSDNSSYIVGKNAAGQLLLGVPRTVTWKDDTGIIDTTTVANGGVPTHADPTKPDDAQNTYTFAGWSDGIRFFAPNSLPEVTGDITFTAIFDATPYVASVTTADGKTTKYTDFDAALNAWTEGTTLTLLSDIEMTTTGRQPSGTEIWGIVVADKKTLDLNGKRLSLAPSVSYDVERVIDVTGGGDLTIKDSSGTNAGEITGVSPNGRNPGWSAGLYINQNGTATMYGGTITGNTTETGAGVLIDGRHSRPEYRAATFNMYGGVIKGNTAEIGGGVYVGNRETNTGYFNMYGGTITDNEATTGRNVYVNGNNAVMTHTGGTINGGFSHDGYVIVFFDKNDGTGTMSAQYVKKNTATTIKKNENYDNNGTKTEPAFTRDGYTFAGWNTEPDGSGFNYTAGTSNLYINNNTILYANWKPKTLIAGHSLTLDGNIGINFYLDPSVAGLTVSDVTQDNLDYTFAWKDKDSTHAQVDVAEQAAQKDFSIEKINGVDYIKVTCHVCAAEMTCDVIASFKLGVKTQSENYSVRQYCDESVIGDDAEYRDNTKLVTLVNAMLDYGAKAQTVFGVNTDDLANSIIPNYSMKNVDSTAFDKAITDANGETNNLATDVPTGATFVTPSLVFLSGNALKLYFTTDESFDTTGLTKWNEYYYAQVREIPAAKLDTLQEFKVGNKTLKYSALDYAKVLLDSGNNNYIALAKALYWYNDAANKYFV